MEVTHLGIHESIEIDFPATVLKTALSDIGPTIHVVSDNQPALSDCDAIVTFAHRDEFLDAGIEWVHTTSAGVDTFPLDRYGDAGVALTNSSGVHGASVGETSIGFMLMLGRRLHTFVKNQIEHEWDRPAWDEAFTLAGESVCVIGLGTVGRGIAKRAAGLGMTVTGVRRAAESIDPVTVVFPPDELHAAIESVRFVALAVPLTDETQGMIGEREFAVMREDAYLVNVARGAVVDEPALVEAVRQGSIAGAALDVFNAEPLPPTSPLWDLDDVIVSPHAAVADRAFYRAIAALVRENLKQITADEPDLTNRVV